MRTTLSLLGFCVFSLFTYWQFNDVDQYGTARIIEILWVLAYGLIALLSLATANPRLHLRRLWLISLPPAILAIFRASAIDWSYANVLYNPSNPAANETGGLIIMTIWLLCLQKIHNRIE